MISVRIRVRFSFSRGNLLDTRGSVADPGWGWYRGNTVFFYPVVQLGHGLEQKRTRIWANAQPDSRPAEHRWRPLFNAAKFKVWLTLTT